MKELRMTNIITEHQNKQRFITKWMFSILLMNRELEWCLFNSTLNDCAEWNKHRSIVQGWFWYKWNNGDCAIVTYPAVEVKQTWQVYITSKLKITLICLLA